MKYPSRNSATSISPLAEYDPQTDNIAQKILNKIMSKANTCMGTSYLMAIKWTCLALQIDTYLKWTEKDYYESLKKYVKTELDLTTSAVHNRMFNDLFSGKAKATQVRYSLSEMKEHVKGKLSPVIFSVDVRSVFNPKATSPMGHIVFGVGQCNNGITIHDPRGKFTEDYKNLQGANTFLSNELLNEIARKEVMNLIEII